MKIEGKVSRVWPNGTVSLYLPGLDYPVTLAAEDIDEVVKARKEPAARNRRKPLYDKPT
ncbi:hypothetical protein [Sinorhizobium meliloti]|uniref:hypothetical protein n=1 Tax=Rhizobium meliloti TaxID=382 RepID=UPI0012973F74|nr:hypothetical protein [Sinorhizobium meliloti]MDW9447153.1 hypothetical protein [Sinorhizobium meliloti]MDW9710002.1 hypothetical protein [Sinorhizobium meliloti]MDW9746845.1 hypothetical protein [Sinorhizobium meliloti]MDX0049611.1 hypothetical protein [Sinorhizobium meliloti]MDX0250246.1 hypothetical protein [Sinorhizobium meliloti]